MYAAFASQGKVIHITPNFTLLNDLHSFYGTISHNCGVLGRLFCYGMGEIVLLQKASKYSFQQCIFAPSVQLKSYCMSAHVFSRSAFLRALCLPLWVFLCEDKGMTFSLHPLPCQEFLWSVGCLSPSIKPMCSHRLPWTLRYSERKWAISHSPLKIFSLCFLPSGIFFRSSWHSCEFAVHLEGELKSF